MFKQIKFKHPKRKNNPAYLHVAKKTFIAVAEIPTRKKKVQKIKQGNCFDNPTKRRKNHEKKNYRQGN